MKKSTLLSLLFVLISTLSLQAQADKPYITTMSKEVCACIGKIADDVSQEKFSTEYLNCFSKSLMAHSKEVQKHYSISNEADMNALGELMGFEMVKICPTSLLRGTEVMGQKNTSSSKVSKPKTVNLVTVGKTAPYDYMKVTDVFNDDYTTIVQIEFYSTNPINGTLHAPGGQYPYVLSDKFGNRFALKYQEGWRGPEAQGFGSISIPAYTERIIKLHFAKISNVENVYSLTEVGCAEAGGNCWNFYDIKVRKR
jgi:hypothetical protein